MNVVKYMHKKYQLREDPDNIYGVGISDVEFIEFVVDYLLGEDWTVVDPLGRKQVNELALYAILNKYSKRFRKETEQFKEELLDSKQPFWNRFFNQRRPTEMGINK